MSTKFAHYIRVVITITLRGYSINSLAADGYQYPSMVCGNELSRVSDHLKWVEAIIQDSGFPN